MKPDDDVDAVFPLRSGKSSAQHSLCTASVTLLLNLIGVIVAVYEVPLPFKTTVALAGTSGEISLHTKPVTYFIERDRHIGNGPFCSNRGGHLTNRHRRNNPCLYETG